MPAPLSVVIPTLDAADALPDTAARLIEGLAGGLIRELVVSDGGSADTTRAIARELGARLVVGPAGRGGQLGRGAEAATAPWLLLLHADTHMPPGWSVVVRRFMAAHPRAAGWGHLSFRAAGLAPRIVAGWANLRSRALGLPYGDQALLVPAALLAEVGGVPPLPLMEDVALARRLRGRLRPLGLTVSTDAARFQRAGWARRGARNLLTLARFAAGADPAVLAERYRR